MPVDETAVPGGAVVRFEQRYAGMPVLGAQVVVRLAGTGDQRTVTGTSSTYADRLSVSAPAKTLTDAAARSAALRALPDTAVATRAPRDLGTAVLPAEGTGRVVRHLVVAGQDTRHGTPVLRDVYLDAATGAVLLNTSVLRTDGDVATTGKSLRGGTVPLHLRKEGAIYQFVDASRGAKAPTVSTYDSRGADMNDVAGQPLKLPLLTTAKIPVPAPLTANGAVDAHYGAGAVVDFYRTRLGRNGLDGKGGPVNSVVGVTYGGEPMANAAWDGEKMIYGSGGDGYKPFSASLDVIAHEMTHGVTSHTAQFVYMGQSGALDEAFADYFGNAVQVTAEKIPMSSPLAGLLGEDLCVTGSKQDCAIRTLHNSSTTYKDFIGTPSDEFGVHINSPIPAGALWELREKLDPALADRIVYRTLVGYMTPLASFEDLRRGVMDAAKAEKVSAVQLATIASAFDRHGIVPGWEKLIGNDAKIVNPRLTRPASNPAAGRDRYVIADMGPKGDQAPFIITDSLSKPGKPRRITPADGTFYTTPATDGTAIAYVQSTVTDEALVDTLWRRDSETGKPVKIATSDMSIENVGVAGPVTVWTAVTTHGDDAERDVFVSTSPGAKPVNLTPAKGVTGFQLVVSGRTVAFALQKKSGAAVSQGIVSYDVATKAWRVLPLNAKEGSAETVDRISISPKVLLWSTSREGSSGRVQIRHSGHDLAKRVTMTSYATGPVLPEVGVTDVALTTLPWPESSEEESNAAEAHLFQQSLVPGSPQRRVSCNRGAQGAFVALDGTRVLFMDATTGTIRLALRNAPVTGACKMG